MAGSPLPDERNQRCELSPPRREELHDALLQALSDLGEAVVIFAGLRLCYANQALSRLCGYSIQELEEMDVLRKLIAPEDREMFAARLAMRERGLEPGTDRYEVAIVHRDGHRVDLEASVKTKWLRDEPYLFLLLRDITERKQMHEQLAESERRFRMLAESTFEAVALTEDNVVVEVNPAHVRLFGYEPEEARGMSSLDLLAPEARPEVQRRVLARDDRPYEALCRRKDGSTFMAEVRTGTSHDRGRVVRVAAVRDITTRRAVDRLKDEFVSVVSHELRTPLTSIRGSLGLLASGKLGEMPPRAEQLIGIAANNADRLVRLVNDILDIERMEAGKSAFLPTDSAMHDLLQNAVEGVRALADRAQVTLQVPPVSGRLWADADRLVQLLTNLLSNAIKFSPAGGTVRVQAERRANEWRIAVSDEGRGIPSDKLESIFGRFQQVDASDARQKGGTGLGLAICRNIAQQHGGRIWAESVLGEGSTFNVVLPVREPSKGGAE